MTAPSFQWDVFLSYAHADEGIARDIREALLSRRTRDGHRPAVFMDQILGSIPAGSSWPDTLAAAIESSRHIVALYSEAYFDSPMCVRELNLAGVIGDLRTLPENRLIPLLLERSALALVPGLHRQVQYLRTTQPDWMGELCRALGLAEETVTPWSLRFCTQPRDILVNHTLDTQRVEVVDEKGERIPVTGVAVTLAAGSGQGGPEGVLTSPLQEGLASYPGLSFASPGPRHLVAQAPGCGPGQTASFRVVPGASLVSSVEVSPGSVIPLDGQPRFLAGDRGLLVRQAGRVSTVALDGAELDVSWPVGPVHLWRRDGRTVALVDFAGVLVTADAEGHLRRVELQPDAARHEHRLAFAGGVGFGSDQVVVGLWNGDLWRVPLDPTAEPIRSCLPDGIQAAAVRGDQVLAAGFDGRIWLDRGTTEPRVVANTEPIVLAMRSLPSVTIVAGAKQAHQIPDSADVTHSATLWRGTPVDTATAERGLIVLQADGHGLCFDAELSVVDEFHTQAGARLVDLDRQGRVLSFSYPDGTCGLMVDGAVTFTAQRGALGISADGSLVAVSGPDGIRIHPRTELV